MIRRFGSLGPDADAGAQRYARAGFRWAAPITLAHGGAEAIRKNRDPAWYRALRRRGVAVWPLWILPTPATWRAELVPFLDHARSVQARGVIIDPEAEFRGEHQEARAFAREARREANARGLVLAVTSYGTPANIPDFPWDEFGESAELGIAQLYDRDDQHRPGYFARGLRQWRSHGFGGEVIPAGSTWSHADQAQKTDAHLRQHLAEIPASSGVILWTMPEIAARVWRIIAAWSPKLTGGRGGNNAGAGGILALLGALGLLAALGRA